MKKEVPLRTAIHIFMAVAVIAVAVMWYGMSHANQPPQVANISASVNQGQ